METVGPYRLDALVGRGTTGSVWQATRLGALAQVVAIKRARADVALEADAADRLRREAAILAELDHPHIVRVVEVLDDGPGVAIVMSLARGGSLHDLLAERGRLTPGQTVAVVSRVADALGSAHRRGVLHGDVKPANILFTSDGEPLLGDFGVAQHLLPGLPGLAGLDETSRGAVEGTTGYVDPDLVATGVPEPRNDVYGLGVVAYLCLTGRLPHAGADGPAVLAAADAGDHLPLDDVRGVPAPLAAVVEAALARRPERRPATALALAQGLRAAVPIAEVVLPGTPLAVPEDEGDDAGAAAEDGDAGGPAPRPPLERRGTRAFGPRPDRGADAPARGHPILTLAAVAVVLVGAVAGGLWARDRLDEEQAPGAVEVAGGGPPAAVACPDLEPLDVPPGAEELEGDLNGDGCPVQVVWNGQVMRFRLAEGDTEPRSYDFRQADDRTPGQLLLGDWDCDGTDTPALYRPSNGVVAYFDTVPGRVGGEATSTSDPTGITGGRARLEPGEDGRCDAVEVGAEA